MDSVDPKVIISSLANRIAELEVDVTVRNAIIADLKERIMQLEEQHADTKERSDAAE